MANTAFREDTSKSLLRPRQVEEMSEEIARLETLVGVPQTDLGRHVQKGLDLPAARRRLKSLTNDFNTQAPQPYKQDQVDLAVRRRKVLLDDITTGMPTQAEMRRNPAGAVDKHRAWERRNKVKIKEFKNIELRLHASGGASRLSDEGDVASIERFRPVGGSGELNMHGEQIPGKSIFLPPIISATNVMSDMDREEIERDTMATMRGLAAGSGPKAAAYKKALALLELMEPDPNIRSVSGTSVPVSESPAISQTAEGEPLAELPVAGDD